MESKEFLRRLKIKRPLVVAPMAGGPSSVEFVVASCEAGALGSVGAAYSAPKEIEMFLVKVRAQTAQSFAVNLFIPQSAPPVTETQISKALQATEKFRQELGLQAPDLQAPYEEDFDQQFETVLKLRPTALSFVFGKLQSEYVKAAKQESIFLIGTATTLEEALELQEAGVDAITLQGVEAGGHRGIFLPNSPDPEISTMELVHQCRFKITAAKIAAGGMMTSSDIEKFFKAGVQAVQMGTAFLTCKEAGTSEPYRRALLANSVRKTRISRAFSGRWARGIENRFMTEIDLNPEAILPFQAQNKFTRDIRAASQKRNSSDFLSLWAGAGAGELWTGTVSDLIDQLFQEPKNQSS